MSKDFPTKLDQIEEYVYGKGRSSDYYPCGAKSGDFGITACNVKPDLKIPSRDGKGTAVTIKSDGTVVLHVDVDEAARLFWGAVGDLGVGYAKENQNLLIALLQKDRQVAEMAEKMAKMLVMGANPL
jgi:hypothetical protein